MQRNQSVVGYWLTSRLGPGSADAAVVAKVVPQLLELAATGRIHGVVRHAFPLEQAGGGPPGRQ